MEKLVYLLWKNELSDGNEYRQQLLTSAIPALQSAAAGNIRCNVVDDAVLPAAGLRMTNTLPAPDAMISFWLDTAIQRKPLEKILQQHALRLAGYLVSESEPMRNVKHPAANGGRTHGMNEVVLLQRPPRLCFDEWIRIWHGSHTRVAMEIQSSFGYRQNVVTRVLTYGAPHYDAIVEENFPPAAMSDRLAFYDSVGNETQFREREKKMLESCKRFIDFDRMDCLPMSEYNFS